MTRPRDVTAMLRPHRFAMHVDGLLLEWLEDIAEEWGVPMPTATYWLLVGLRADAAGDDFVMAGDFQSEKLARWLVGRFGSGGLDGLD